VPSAAIGGLAPLQPYHHTNLNVSQQHEEQIDDDDDDDAIGIAYTDLPKQPSQQHHQQQYPRF
jgi:hypothetical protein